MHQNIAETLGNLHVNRLQCHEERFPDVSFQSVLYYSKCPRKIHNCRVQGGVDLLVDCNDFPILSGIFSGNKSKV